MNSPECSFMSLLHLHDFCKQFLFYDVLGHDFIVILT